MPWISISERSEYIAWAEATGNPRPDKMNWVHECKWASFLEHRLRDDEVKKQSA